MSIEKDILQDAKRYRRLQVLGCAPGTSKQLKNGTVLCFTNLDDFIDDDISAHPSRGEAKNIHLDGNTQHPVARTIDQMPPEGIRTKAEEWEAMYAALFRQMNEMVATKRELQKQVDISATEIVHLIEEAASNKRHLSGVKPAGIGTGTAQAIYFALKPYLLPPKREIKTLTNGQLQEIGLAAYNAYIEFNDNAAIPHMSRHMGKMAVEALSNIEDRIDE